MAYGDPVQWVIGRNLHRRHLTALQRASCVSAALEWANQGKRHVMHTDRGDSGQYSPTPANIAGVGGPVTAVESQLSLEGADGPAFFTQDERAALSDVSVRTQAMSDTYEKAGLGPEVRSGELSGAEEECPSCGKARVRRSKTETVPGRGRRRRGIPGYGTGCHLSREIERGTNMKREAEDIESATVFAPVALSGLGLLTVLDQGRLVDSNPMSIIFAVLLTLFCGLAIFSIVLIHLPGSVKLTIGLIVGFYPIILTLGVGRGGRSLLLGITMALLLGFSAIAIHSVGIFFLPAALAMLVATAASLLAKSSAPSPPGNPAINGQTINQKRGGTMNKTDDRWRSRRGYSCSGWTRRPAQGATHRMHYGAHGTRPSGASARAKVQRP